MAEIESIFFDSHMHAMSIGHPNYVAFIHEIESNFTDEAVSGMFSPTYIASASNANSLLSRLQMILSLMDRSIGDIFGLMEEDLSTPFSPKKASRFSGKQAAEHPPYISDGLFTFRDRQYRNIGLCPMIMDFSHPEQRIQGVYTYEYPEEKLIRYIEDTRSGIHAYQKHSPTGIFRIFPFLGINPRAHDLDFIEHLLGTYLIDAEGRRETQFCHGVKFYPPLDFDPWPEDEPEELEKAEFIYDHCVSRGIPVTTHCDDQGFRSIGVKTAWDYSSPKRWEKVLKHYPDLAIDFAHYGWQYRPSASLRNRTSASLRINSSITDTWFTDILQLMQDYDQVYADFSFSGASEGFYRHLIESLKFYSHDEQERILSRSMFGSDYFVNLSKVDSYSHYYALFENSLVPDDQVHAFASGNVLSWLFPSHDG